MKKLAVVGIMLLALGATTFAKGHKNWSDPAGGIHHSKNGYCQSPSNHKSFKRNPEIEKSNILIEEKRLEIKKELLKDSPDWNKVEKLNIEISTERGKMKTTEMKARFEYNKTLPNQN